MSDRRIVSSDRASCPNCGGIEAIVRVRGNAFAATCTTCRESAIVPMLSARELLDAFGELPDLARVVSIMRAAGRDRVLVASRAVVDDSPDLRGELDRRLDVAMRATLRLP